MLSMPGQESKTFQEVLDIIESLPEYQQEDIIQIINRTKAGISGEKYWRSERRICTGRGEKGYG